MYLHETINYYRSWQPSNGPPLQKGRRAPVTLIQYIWWKQGWVEGNNPETMLEGRMALHRKHEGQEKNADCTGLPTLAQTMLWRR